MSIDKFLEHDEELERQLDRDAGPPVGESDPYHELPQPIKMRYNRVEYLWLSDDEKNRLVDTECTPEF